MPALSCLPGIGTDTARSIAAARNEADFTSVDDLRSRTGVSERQIDVLRDMGCLKGLPESAR